MSRSGIWIFSEGQKELGFRGGDPQTEIKLKKGKKIRGFWPIIRPKNGFTSRKSTTSDWEGGGHARKDQAILDEL